mmetsp:Transcript_35326/g.82502  ORF Transcript_35326/g.82502 Transcript_35326/m.82502 type:complete len:284 (-) Transcript_35326:666-1517(-)
MPPTRSSSSFLCTNCACFDRNSATPCRKLSMSAEVPCRMSSTWLVSSCCRFLLRCSRSWQATVTSLRPSCCPSILSQRSFTSWQRKSCIPLARELRNSSLSVSAKSSKASRVQDDSGGNRTSASSARIASANSLNCSAVQPVVRLASPSEGGACSANFFASAWTSSSKLHNLAFIPLVASRGHRGGRPGACRGVGVSSCIPLMPSCRAEPGFMVSSSGRLLLREQRAVEKSSCSSCAASSEDVLLAEIAVCSEVEHLLLASLSGMQVDIWVITASLLQPVPNS